MNDRENGRYLFTSHLKPYISQSHNKLCNTKLMKNLILAIKKVLQYKVKKSKNYSIGNNILLYEENYQEISSRNCFETMQFCPNLNPMITLDLYVPKNSG